MITVDTPLTNRLFYRCIDCLATGCIDSADKPAGSKVDCGICGGYMQLLGKVTGERWAREETHVPVTCNESCQSAQGPEGTCHCGGVNHGLGFRYVTEVIEGKVIITPENNHAKHLAIANEFRGELDSAMARIESRFGDTWKLFRRGQWISDKGLWWQMHIANELLDKAQDAKQHKPRIAKLRSILSD